MRHWMHGMIGSVFISMAYISNSIVFRRCAEAFTFRNKYTFSSFNTFSFAAQQISNTIHLALCSAIDRNKHLWWTRFIRIYKCLMWTSYIIHDSQWAFKDNAPVPNNDVPVGVLAIENHLYDKRKTINAENMEIAIHFHLLLLVSTFAPADEASMSKDGIDWYWAPLSVPLLLSIPKRLKELIINIDYTRCLRKMDWLFIPQPANKCIMVVLKCKNAVIEVKIHLAKIYFNDCIFALEYQHFAYCIFNFTS